MKPRKGHRVKVIRDGKMIAVCENIGDAVRMTQISCGTIRKRINDGYTTNGYKFKEVECE